MARKTKAAAEETRNQILDAAEKVFGERGVARTSLHEIAESAGLTRGAVYWHFKGKYDLLSALWQRVLMPMDEAFAAIDQEMEQDPLGRIRAKTRSVAHRIVHDPRMQNMMGIQLLRCEMVDEIAAARTFILAEREQCLQQIADGFRAAVAAEQLRSGIEPKAAAIGLHAIIDGLCYHWLLDPSRFDLEVETVACVDAWLVGLGAVLVVPAPRVRAKKGTRKEASAKNSRAKNGLAKKGPTRRAVVRKI
ncbi:MAG: TetR family transcriptional regulator [Planctomycetota bacterium]